MCHNQAVIIYLEPALKCFLVRQLVPMEAANRQRQSDLVSGFINQQLIRQSHSFDYICCS